MKLKINITKEILKESMFCNGKEGLYKSMVGQNCAIGKAIYKLFGAHSWVAYKGILIFLNPQDMIANLKQTISTKPADFLIPLSEKAQNFILEFDSSTPEQRLLMKPFSFEIDVLEGVIDMIGIEEVEKVLEESLSMEKV